MTDLWGDVGTQGILDHYTNDRYTDKVNFMGGMYGRYTIHPSVVARFGINYGVLYANDNWNESKARQAKFVEDDAYQRYLRNLAVKTNIWEGNLMLEINPLRFSTTSVMARRRFSPYLLLGVGYFHYTPKGQLDDPTGNYVSRWVNLSELNTEGDGWFGTNNMEEKPSNWAMQVPLGLGFKWDVGRHLAIGVEYIYRYTFTDKIDDVSGEYIDPALFDKNLSAQKAAQARALYDRSYLVNPLVHHSKGELRGNSEVNDGYSTIGITIYYKLKRKRTPWWL